MIYPFSAKNSGYTKLAIKLKLTRFEPKTSESDSNALFTYIPDFSN